MDHTKEGQWKRVVAQVVLDYEASKRPQLPDIDPEHKLCNPRVCQQCYPRRTMSRPHDAPYESYDGGTHWKFFDTTDYDKFF